jgi:hypothetical protein
MQSSTPRLLFSVEYFLRVSAWLLALSSEVFFGWAIKLLQEYANYYVLAIFLATLLCICVRYMGAFPVMRDLQELCFYDVLVQIYGLVLFATNTSFASYLIAAIAVYLLKFIRLVWWGKNLEGELLAQWPVFGILGLFSKDRIEEKISNRQRIVVYGTIVLTVIAAFFVWLFFQKIEAAFMHFAGVINIDKTYRIRYSKAGRATY